LCEKAYAENKDENHDENNPIRLASSGFHKADSFVQPPKHSLIPRETDYYRRLIAKGQRVLSEGANRLLVLRAEDRRALYRSPRRDDISAANRKSARLKNRVFTRWFGLR